MQYKKLLLEKKWKFADSKSEEILESDWQA